MNNYSQFSYDGFWRNTKIVETTSGSVTSTKQFIWCGHRRCEARDQSSNPVSYFYGGGQKYSGSSFVFSKDHLGTVRELTNAIGVVQAQYAFDPYGRKTVISENVSSEIQYAGYYLHPRSERLLTLHRQYNPHLGIWQSRDPVSTVVRAYAYVNSNPIRFIDPIGLGPFCKGCAPPDQGQSGTSSGSDGNGNSTGQSSGTSGSSGSSNGAGSGAAAATATTAAAGAGTGTATATGASGGGMAAAFGAAMAAIAAAMSNHKNDKLDCSPEPPCHPGEFDPVSNYSECLDWCFQNCKGYDYLECESWCNDEHRGGK